MVGTTQHDRGLNSRSSAARLCCRLFFPQTIREWERQSAIVNGS